MSLRRIAFACGVVVLGLSLAGCGGGLQEEPGPAQTRAGKPQAAVAPVLNATALMDWAEGPYASFFPGHQADQAYGPYIYRYYPATGNYLGVAGSDIYVMFAGSGTPLYVGQLDDFYCQVHPSYCLSGTAATGAPIAGAMVTLKDATGATVAATTSASGTYAVRTSSLTPPYLLQVTPVSGTALYSVTANSQPTVANITPWTDLLVRSWYGVQGVTPQSAFGALSTYPPPNPTQVNVLGEALLSVAQLAINVHGADISAPADFITRPFAANGQGTDRLLDHTSMTFGTAGATLVLSVGTATQTTALSYSTSTTSLTAQSTTTDGTSTTSGTLVQVVPVSTAQATAIDEINAVLAAFAGVVNSKGASLAAADIVDFFAEDLLDFGLNRTQLVNGTVAGFVEEQPLQVQLQVQQVLALNTATGEADLVVRFRQTAGTAVDIDDEPMRMRKVSGQWRIAGDGRIAEIDVQAEARNNQGAYTGGSGAIVNVGVAPLQGAVSSVSVSSSLGTQQLFGPGATSTDDSGAVFTSFSYNIGPLTGALPPAGTPFTLTLALSGGGTVSYTQPLNAFTTELIQITSPTGSSLASANLGGTLNVNWTLPTTYAVQRVRLSAFFFTGNPSSNTTHRCESEAGILGVTATSGSLQMLATCEGRPVTSVNLNVSVDGPNGERSQVIYTMN